MAFSRNESSRIFVEHALHFARIQFRTQAINCVWYKRLSYKNQLNNYRMLAHLKNQFDERKTGLTVQKFGLRRLQRLDTIHEEPP